MRKNYSFKINNNDVSLQFSLLLIDHFLTKNNISELLKQREENQSLYRCF